MTEKDEYLEFWGYKIGTPEAEEAWKAKQSMTRQTSAMVIPDIQPYKSMITGEMITSRSKHRTHLKDHNCIEVGNEKMTQKPVAPPKGLREALERAAYSTK